MMDRCVMIPFQEHHGTEVVRWALSAEEARRWGGPNTPWPTDPSVFPRWHADPDVQPYVLYDGDVSLGYGELWVDGDEQEVELARIIIKPTHRGQGVGRQFVSLLLERAMRTGYPWALIRVVPENGIAIACYRSAGFFPVPEFEQAQYNRGQPVEYLWLQRELMPL
ncbi:MAG TPA: GNAT family N-acetyltransferase [Chthonomonadaceae bacterium]|nr:GNAT family N-acetyltransferase [Chthonomonadaceae bacterium]